MTKADARNAGFTNGTVTNAWRELEARRASGELPPADPNANPAKISRIAKASRTLEEIERVADDLVFNGRTESIQLKAIDTAARVKLLTGNRGDIGAGRPLTRDERHVRMAMLRQAMEAADGPEAA